MFEHLKPPYLTTPILLLIPLKHSILLQTSNHPISHNPRQSRPRADRNRRNPRPRHLLVIRQHPRHFLCILDIPQLFDFILAEPFADDNGNGDAVLVVSIGVGVAA